ncbi:MAG: flavin reductase [Chloroflexi bacterium]|nr:flavin reductase [Chloroflexota bacterium]
MGDIELFKKAWSKFPTGVSVISSITPDNKIHGMAANGIMSVSLDPMLVVISMSNSSTSFKYIEKNKKYGINILKKNQELIANYYASSTEDKSIDKSSWFNFANNGVPFLKNCLASMSCNVVEQYKSGDHTLFIGKVDEIIVNEGDPLLFYNSSFGKL